MMAVVIVLSGLSAGLVALATVMAVAWRGASNNERKSMLEIVASGKREIDERIKRNEAENAAAHLTFELGKQTDALRAAQTRAKIIEEELNNATKQTSLGDGLDARDVAGRLRRIAAEARKVSPAQAPPLPGGKPR